MNSLDKTNHAERIRRKKLLIVTDFGEEIGNQELEICKITQIATYR